MELVKPLDPRFFSFVNRYHITYIPFTTNREWGVDPEVDFQDITSPYWRIESGVVAVKACKESRRIFRRVLRLYAGKMLNLSRKCIYEPDSRGICSAVWLRRNVYMDDIFALSLVLHQMRHEYGPKSLQGWFSIGCSPRCGQEQYRKCIAALPSGNDSPYPYPHVCPSQTSYTVRPSS